MFSLDYVRHDSRAYRKIRCSGACRLGGQGRKSRQGCFVRTATPTSLLVVLVCVPSFVIMILVLIMPIVVLARQAHRDGIVRRIGKIDMSSSQNRGRNYYEGVARLHWRSPKLFTGELLDFASNAILLNFETRSNFPILFHE